jgi:hypothetical protein
VTGGDVSTPVNTVTQYSCYGTAWNISSPGKNVMLH